MLAFAGKAPYGYQYEPGKGLQPHKVEKQNLKMILSLYASGLNIRQIIRELESRGIMARSGKHWSPMTIYSMIIEKRIEFYNGSINGEKTGVPAIIDDKLFVKVMTRLSKNEKKGHQIKREYPLSGRSIFFCGYCGSPMGSVYTKKPNGTKYHYYRCTTTSTLKRDACPKSILITKELAEELVFTEIRSKISLIPKIFEAYKVHKTSVAKQNVKKILDKMDVAKWERIPELAEEIKTEYHDSIPVYPFEGKLTVNEDNVENFLERIEIFDGKLVLTFTVPIDNEFNFVRTIRYGK